MYIQLPRKDPTATEVIIGLNVYDASEMCQNVHNTSPLGYSDTKTFNL